MPVLKLPRNLLIVIALALTLLPSGVVRASPPAPGTVFTQAYLKVHLPADPLCVGRQYTLTAEPMLKQTYTEKFPDPGTNPVHTFFASPGPVKISAHTDDPGIASITPPWVVSGSNPEDDLPNAAYFFLTTKKAGSTNVTFDAEIDDRTIGPGFPIKVVNCKYKVTAVQRGTWSAGGTGGTTSASMSTTISGEGGQLSGSGSFRLAVTIRVPSCGAGVSMAPIATNVKGSVSGMGDLTLSLDYAPSYSGTSSLTCPYIGNVGGSGGGPTSDILAVNSASLPEEGGSRTFNYGCLSGYGSCSLTITADPLPG